jgi:hypothetical protein
MILCRSWAVDNLQISGRRLEMKSQYLSLFSDTSSAAASAAATESSDGNPPASEPENFSGEVASYSARYQAFLYQQSLRNQRANRQGGLDVLTSLGRGLLNLTLFVAFFFGFLTLFGFGLSRLSGNSYLIQNKVSASAPNAGADAANTSSEAAAPKKSARGK